MANNGDLIWYERHPMIFQPGDLAIFDLFDKRLISLIVGIAKDNGDWISYYVVWLKPLTSERDAYYKMLDQTNLSLKLGEKFSVIREGKTILEIVCI